MCLWLGVTGCARLRRSLEYIVLVAGRAFDVGVCAGQLECRQVMIETGRLPGLRRVALPAVRAECALVRIVLQVAIGTGNPVARLCFVMN